MGEIKSYRDVKNGDVITDEAWERVEKTFDGMFEWSISARTVEKSKASWRQVVKADGSRPEGSTPLTTITVINSPKTTAKYKKAVEEWDKKYKSK